MTAPTTEPFFLSEDECFAVLAADRVGRVNFTRHVMPSSATVAYAVRGRELFLRPDAPSRLARLLDGAAVCFEVDVTSPDQETAWRVVVVGTAYLSGDPRDRLVRIRPTDVTGHRLPAPRLPL
jgi:nitroimidazol reductase NimA-like FMN-containing flavoprotein (pyridoxamine 5'-phosphate oxidase superfamily)